MFATPRRWTPAQWNVLTCLAWYENDRSGYAWVTVETIADHIGWKPRRTWQVLEELERNRLAARLGPDRRRHRAGQQRWRLTLDEDFQDGSLPVEEVDDVDRHPAAGCRVEPVENSGSPCSPLQGDRPVTLQPVAGSPCSRLQFHPAARCRGSSYRSGT